MFDVLPEKSRRVLYRFAGWFFCINVILALVIAVSYINAIPDYRALVGATTASVLVGWIFLVTTFITQMAILFFIASAIVMLIISFIPWRSLTFIFAILLSALLFFSLIADRIAYSIYHMHYAAVGLEIIRAGALSQVIPLSKHEKIVVVGLFVVLILMECLIAWLTWRRVRQQKHCRKGYVFTVVLVICFLVSYSLNFLATRPIGLVNLAGSHSILETARLVPYYNEIYGSLMPGDTSVRHILTTEGDVDFQIRKPNRPLQYPLHFLQCKQPQQRLNILVIGIDTWRYDAMTPIISPNIYHFAQKTQQFQNEWSGGNCTEPGLFSLFYGIPANYWRAAIQQQRGPALIRKLIDENYNMAIYTSAPLNWPAFDKTIFRDVKNLIISIPGDSTVSRDQAITQEFKNFLKTRNSNQPFFSFLFYDAVHNYCDPVTPSQHPFKPWIKSCDRFSLTQNVDPTPYVNRYHNAVHFVDDQVQQVLDALQQKGLLKNTIVILTADHGEEINDNHSGYWEHASAYDAYQLHVPMLVYWPGKQPKVYNYFTSHYDLAPTLMSQVLGCQNPAADYSIGNSLFNSGNRSVLVAGSYADYAIVTHDRATRVYPGGDYVIDDPRGRHLDQATLKKTPLEQAFELLNKYFKP